MRRLVAGIFALGFGFLSVPSGSGAARVGVRAVSADPTASDCVGFRKSDLDRGLSFDADSSCDKKLSCTLSWVLTCESDKGQVTRRIPETRRFSIDARGTASETASAESCKQAWRIDDVRWSCNEAK